MLRSYGNSPIMERSPLSSSAKSPKFIASLLLRCVFFILEKFGFITLSTTLYVFVSNTSSNMSFAGMIPLINFGITSSNDLSACGSMRFRFLN